MKCAAYAGIHAQKRRGIMNADERGPNTHTHTLTAAWNDGMTTWRAQDNSEVQYTIIDAYYFSYECTSRICVRLDGVHVTKPATHCTDTLFHYTDSAMHSAKLPPINSRQISFLHYHRSQLFFQPKHLDCDAKEWREGTQHWILNESLCGYALCASAWIERITTVRPKRIIWCQLKVNICMTTDGDVVSARRKRKRLRETRFVDAKKT